MSAELYTASQPAENNGSLQTTTVGGSKPLHRFLQGQPKIMGTVVLIIGASFFILSIAISTGHFAHHIWTTIPPGFLLGTLFIISGILFIVTELNPTKKTVTISLALSIVSILGACWTVLHILPDLHFLRSSAYFDENITDTDVIGLLWRGVYQLLFLGVANLTDPPGWACPPPLEEESVPGWKAMGVTVEALFLFYSFVGAIIFIVMSVLAGAALRSTKSQAIVVMTTTSTTTPAD